MHLKKYLILVESLYLKKNKKKRKHHHIEWIKLAAWILYLARNVSADRAYAWLLERIGIFIEQTCLQLTRSCRLLSYAAWGVSRLTERWLPQADGSLLQVAYLPPHPRRNLVEPRFKISLNEKVTMLFDVHLSTLTCWHSFLTLWS